ncbi:phosphoesterase PA-phosphatase [Symbioplanes lichenis]|uniref:phosphoesterase PA-phosphatase n=1 Tax=Symbioplanes lichenis TaxID=1629072 RepID=UPI002739874C|nr:phosphoesterase PA-phosphatase [Actinoplanes lichenis]
MTLESTSRRIARLITEVFSPGILVAVLVLLVAWHSSRTVGQAVTYGLVSVASASVLPVLFILRGVRRGHWTDKHVTVHTQRRVPLTAVLASTVAGVAALALTGAPRELLALVAAMIASLLVAAPITVLTGWGVSIHALVAAGTVAALTVVFGPAVAAAAVVVAAVCWARVRLGEHTIGQVLAGAAIGTAATGILFPALL